MLYRDGQIVREALHLARAWQSIKQLQFDFPSFFTTQFFANQVHDTVRKNDLGKLARVRATFFRGSGGLYDAENLNLNYLIQIFPLEESRLLLNQNGLIIGVANCGFKAADKLANLKSNNYLLYAMAALEAKRNGWNDAVVLNHHQRIADTTIANIWAIKDNKIYTPPLSEGPVAGVVRQFILASKYDVKELPLSPVFFDEADALFLTNAIFGVRWVKQYGEVQFRQHPLITQLHRHVMTY